MNYAWQGGTTCPSKQSLLWVPLLKMAQQAFISDLPVKWANKSFYVCEAGLVENIKRPHWQFFIVHK